MNKSQDEKRIRAFGKRVKQLREAANVSQEQLAFESEINVTQIARIERGEINTGIKNAFRIAEALEIAPHLLFIFDK